MNLEEQAPCTSPRFWYALVLTGAGIVTGVSAYVVAVPRVLAGMRLWAPFWLLILYAALVSIAPFLARRCGKKLFGTALVSFFAALPLLAGADHAASPFGRAVFDVLGLVAVAALFITRRFGGFFSAQKKLRWTELVLFWATIALLVYDLMASTLFPGLKTRIEPPAWWLLIMWFAWAEPYLRRKMRRSEGEIGHEPED